MEQIRGTVYKVESPRKISEKFTVQNIVIQEDLVTKYGEQTSHYLIQAGNDRMKMLEGIREGMEVKVKFYVAGRKYINKMGQEAFMVTLNLASIESDQQFSNKGRMISQDDPIENYDNTKDNGKDDLPF